MAYPKKGRNITMNKIDWGRKLTSRKLWMAIIGFVSGLILAFGGSESLAETVGGCILQGASVLGYLFAEGLTDAANTPGEGEGDIQNAIQQVQGTGVMISKTTSIWDRNTPEEKEKPEESQVSVR